jgi:hypothetical protein
MSMPNVPSPIGNNIPVIVKEFLAAPNDSAYMAVGVGTLGIAANAAAAVGVGTAFVAGDVGKVIKVGLGAAMKFFQITSFTDALNIGVRNVTRPELQQLTNDAIAVVGASFQYGFFSRYDRLERDQQGASAVWKNLSTGVTIPASATQPIIGASALYTTPGQMVGSSDPQAVACLNSVVGAGTVSVSLAGNVAGVGTAFTAADVGKRFIEPITGFESTITGFASATAITVTPGPAVAIVAGTAFNLSVVSALTLSDVRHNYAVLQNDANGADVVFESGPAVTHPAKATGGAVIAAGGSIALAGITPQFFSARTSVLATSSTLQVSTSFLA